MRKQEADRIAAPTRLWCVRMKKIGRVQREAWWEALLAPEPLWVYLAAQIKLLPQRQGFKLEPLINTWWLSRLTGGGVGESGRKIASQDGGGERCVAAAGDNR